jgi:hypothetical protein
MRLVCHPDKSPSTILATIPSSRIDPRVKNRSTISKAPNVHPRKGAWHHIRRLRAKRCSVNSYLFGVLQLGTHDLLLLRICPWLQPDDQRRRPLIFLCWAPAALGLCASRSAGFFDLTNSISVGRVLAGTRDAE